MTRLFPWKTEHRLLRIGLEGKDIVLEEREVAQKGFTQGGTAIGAAAG